MLARSWCRWQTRGMQDKLGVWEIVAIVLAVLTCIGAAWIVATVGTARKMFTYGTASLQTGWVVNWVLIAYVAAAALYAIMFAALMCNARRSRNRIDEALRLLRMARSDALAEKRRT